MAELIDRQLLNVRQAVGRRRAAARLWRAPTIRIMTASGGAARWVGAKEAQFDLSLLCACATTVIGTRGTPLRMKFEFDFHVTGAPLRPSIQFVVAQPLSKLPLRVNSCFPRARVRHAVQRVVHPFHMWKELPCPLFLHFTPLLHLHPSSVSPLCFWVWRSNNVWV